MRLGLEVQLLIEYKKNARTTSTSWTIIFLAEQEVCGIFFNLPVKMQNTATGKE